MPFKIKKIRNENLYKVINTQTGQEHSHGTTLEKAQAQLRILHQKTGEGIIFNKVLTTIKGRTNISPSFKSILEKEGNKKIIKIYIEREPLPILYTQLADYITSNKFSSNTVYDTLYHLRLVIELEDGMKYNLEKLAQGPVINIYKSNNILGTQQLPVSIKSFITLNDLIEKTIEKMGITRFLEYKVNTENCQNFVLNILEANHLSTEYNKYFVLQDIKNLFNDIEYVKYMANFITEIIHRGDVFLQGGSIKNKKIKVGCGIMDYLPSKETAAQIALAVGLALFLNKVNNYNESSPSYEPSTPINPPFKPYEGKFTPIEQPRYAKLQPILPLNAGIPKQYKPPTKQELLKVRQDEFKKDLLITKQHLKHNE